MHLYFLNADPIVRPTNWIGGWDSAPAGNANTKGVDDVADGSETRNYAVSEGFAAGPQAIGVTRLCGRPLATQTISGTVDLVMGALASAGSDFYWKVYIYVTQGSSLTLVRGVLLDYEDTGGTAWPTTYTGRSFVAPQALTPVNVVDGDVLVVEIGYVRTGAGSGRTGTVKIGCMSSTYGLTALADLSAGSTSVTTLAGFLNFSNAVTRLAAPANDTAAAAIVLPTVPYSGTLNLVTANREGDEPQTCMGGPTDALGRYHSVWYEWTCPADQSVTVTAALSGGLFTFQTCLLVLTGSPGSWVTVDCAGGTAPTTESITFAATNGVTYTFMVGSGDWTGGTSMTFTFTPAAVPVADETLAPLQVTDMAATTALTAMGWIVLDTNPTAADLHFWAIGDGTLLSPLTAPYIWVGTADDGVTLQLVIDDGGGAVVTSGPVLDLGTFYHWAYVRSGDTHRVYLSTELGDPLDVSVAIGPVTAPITLAADFTWFFGSAMAIPKAFKLWETNLDVAQIRIERETYAVVEKTGIYNVSRLQTDVSVSTGGWTDYSGYDRRAGSSFVPTPHEWPLRKGPVLLQQAARPFSDNFEAYADGYWDGGTFYFPGVVDQAVYYNYPTQPTIYSYIHAGVGVGGSQAVDSIQSGIDVWFEHDAPTTNCGVISVDSFRSSDSLGRGVGIQITDLPQYADTGYSFGFLSNAGTGDIVVYNTLGGGDVTVSNVYTVGVYQHVELRFVLSTVAPGGLDVLADGQWRILVDGALVYNAEGQKLSVDPSGWATGRNAWSGVSLTWGGYIDNLAVDTACLNCPGTRGAPLAGV